MPIFSKNNTDFSNELNMAIQNFRNLFNFYFSDIQTEINNLLSNQSVSPKNIQRLEILNNELKLVSNFDEAIAFLQKLTKNTQIIYNQLNQENKNFVSILDELNEITAY